MLKPVILITLYRRYFTYLKVLKNIAKFKHEFSIEPDIIVIYAQPEPQMMFLVEQPIVNKVIQRPKLIYEGERHGTTYPESHNIRMGLEYIKKNYNNCYALIQTADVFVKEGCYGTIDHIMNNGKDAAVAHWNNSIVSSGCYHTNMFAVSMDEKHWPPVCNYDEHDVLEWAWGKRLNNYLDWVKYNFEKFNNEFFEHLHVDGLLPFESKSHLSVHGRDKYQQELLLSVIGKAKYTFRDKIRNIFRTIKSLYKQFIYEE